VSRFEDHPLVSVVVASYNMLRYLPRAIDSILGQSYPNLEVIVVDDGSTDATASFTASLSGDRRINVCRQDNRGQASAKNRGIELSRGDFIGFLDADDLWLPDKLARQLPLFEGRPDVGVVYSEYECIDAEGRKVPKGPTDMRRGRVSGQLLIQNFVSFPTALVRRECFERCGAFNLDYGMGIDYDLWLRISANYEFDFIADPTVLYRVWDGQMSKNYRKRYEAAIRIMQNFIELNPDAVPPAVVRTAWAHTYAGRGDSVLWNERDKRAARADYWRALTYRPTYWPAWRAVLRSYLTLRPPSAG
jgi:glycosyltransferase involved in cell wall biosynthesis